MTILDETDPLAQWQPQCDPVTGNTTEFERRVLASALYANTAPAEVLERLLPEHFYRPAHGEIWRVVTEVLLAGDDLDITRVIDMLRDTAPGAIDALHRIASAGPGMMAVDVDYLADKIIDGWYARRVQEKLIRAQQRLAAGYAQQANDILTGDDEYQPERYGWTLDEIYDELVEEAQQPNLVVPTPWRTINSALFGGLSPGRLYVFAGAPGTGKTMSAQMVTAHAATTGAGAMFFSLEMSRTELLRRLFASGAGVPMAEAMSHEFLLTSDSARHVHEFRATVRDAGHNLIVNDQEGLTVETVRAKASLAARRHNLGVVVVDYLQLVDAPTTRNEVEQVRHVARGLKSLAKRLRKPVLALAQPNRNASYQDRKLVMSDLHGSSEIEKAADVIVLLNREVNDDADVPTMFVEFDIVKNRQGRLAQVRMLFDGSRQSFQES